MHICFIANEFPLPGISFGGIGTFLYSYSKILIENGHQVSVVGVIDGTEVHKLNFEGVYLHYNPKSKVKGLSWYFNSKNITKAIKEIHKDSPIDIVEAQEAGFAFVEVPKHIPKVIRMHGGHSFFAEFENKKINKWKAFQEKLSFNKCDAVIATSEFVRIQTAKYIEFSNKSNITINNPILMDMFRPAMASKVIKGAAVFAGTICEKKGIRQLCLAIPDIVKQVPEFHLYAYGREWYFSDGVKYKDWLLDQLSDEIKSRITFREPVKYEDLPKVYEFSEICIFPSHMEVQGLVAPEAMSMKKPVIFTKYGPGPETIDDDINGWLCEPRSSKSISDTVIKVFKSRSRFVEIGENARKKVEMKFSPAIIYGKNINFYLQILKK
ncbi:glycosyltransferase family 4 protein [Flavobacterium frigoris]|uniref:Glycosyltransferase involved in cell wall bisynthesis n=1 Tax=Flavobacterium frigoris TaxID=229204 RepID=A0A1H9QZ20_FLAFI|nr:glycosyltransferase family 4 protein [Flavobacterium frigoris]SER65069.1 Glycosyltransferase involved in cell wall bisynthesis [Flavobacterium frigoris]